MNYTVQFTSASTCVFSILYSVTLATHYNEIHVAKQPHIIFLSCDFFIDTSRNPSKQEERQTLPFCQSSTDGERHPDKQVCRAWIL